MRKFNNEGFKKFLTENKLTEQSKNINEGSETDRDKVFRELQRLTRRDDGFVKRESGRGKKIIVGGEMSIDKDGLPLFDYYGEFRGGTPWVSPKVKEILDKYDWGYEWYDPGTVHIVPEI